MKYKYVKMNNDLLFEEDWITFLNDMLKQGYKLKKIGFYRYCFEPCDYPIKYQIDYTPLNEEYLQMTKAMGYEYLDSFQDIHIFCSKDMNAVDLQTDEETLKKVLLKKYNKKRIILSFGMAVIFGMIGIFMFLKYMCFHLGFFYIHLNDILLSICTLIMAIYFIILGIILLKARQKVKYQKELEINSPLIRKMFRIFLYIFFIGIMIGGLYFLITQFSIQYILFNGILFFLYIVMIQRIIPKQKSEIIRRLMTILAISIFICGNSYLYLNPRQNDSQITKDYPFSSHIIDSNSNIFLKKMNIDADYLHIYYQCYNENIAKEVFDTNIQCLPEKQEYDDLTLDDIFKEGMILYDKAIQYYQKYPSSLVDECFYRQHYFVARKDKTVIKCYIREQKDIDKILSDYFQ